MCDKSNKPGGLHPDFYSQAVATEAQAEHETVTATTEKANLTASSGNIN